MTLWLSEIFSYMMESKGSLDIVYGLKELGVVVMLLKTNMKVCSAHSMISSISGYFFVSRRACMTSRLEGGLISSSRMVALSESLCMIQSSFFFSDSVLICPFSTPKAYSN